MQRLVIFQFPVPGDDLSAIEALLRNESVFCSSFPDQDAYSALLYHSEALEHGTSACIVLDRNVFGRIIELTRGKPATAEHRIAAAIMAFGQCADIVFEPALALYDGTASRSDHPSFDELALFRAADNLNPLMPISLSEEPALYQCRSPRPSLKNNCLYQNGSGNIRLCIRLYWKSG